MKALEEKRGHTLFSQQQQKREKINAVSLEDRAPKRAATCRWTACEARIIARHLRERRRGCCDEFVPIEVIPTGVRHRRCRHHRVQHVAVARVDRACGAYAVRAVRSRETAGDDAPRLKKEVLFGSRARDDVTTSQRGERTNCASRRCRCCCAGIQSVDFEFRERDRSSTRDQSRSQTPIPPESARDRCFVWKKKNDLCRRVFCVFKLAQYN